MTQYNNHLFDDSEGDDSPARTPSSGYVLRPPVSGQAGKLFRIHSLQTSSLMQGLGRLLTKREVYSASFFSTVTHWATFEVSLQMSIIDSQEIHSCLILLADCVIAAVRCGPQEEREESEWR